MSPSTCESQGQRSLKGRPAHKNAPAATGAPYKHRWPLQKAPCVCITQCITLASLPSPRPQYGTGKPDRRNKNRLVLKQYPTWLRSQYFPHSYQTILGYALVYRAQVRRTPSLLPPLPPQPPPLHLPPPLPPLPHSSITLLTFNPLPTFTNFTPRSDLHSHKTVKKKYIFSLGEFGVRHPRAPPSCHCHYRSANLSSKPLLIPSLC